MAEIGGADRFGSESKLAMHAGVAPLPCSSGGSQRYRLNRSGNHQLNLALHRIALTQARVHAPAREYLERRQADGLSKREAMRSLEASPRPTRLQRHAVSDNGPRIDIGATLKQTITVLLLRSLRPGGLMKRNALRILTAGLVLFVVGAVGGPVLGSDTNIPVWIATWAGVALLLVGAAMFVVGRTKTP